MTSPSAGAATGSGSPQKEPRSQTSFLGSFSRAQASSAMATAADFGVLFLLAEALHVWYVAATATGAAVGAITNFLLNRYWSFRADNEDWKPQAFRYAFVSGGSLALNTGGVWAVTEGFKVPYGYSVLVVSLVVGLGFNFPLHRYFVFRDRAAAAPPCGSPQTHAQATEPQH